MSNYPILTVRNAVGEYRNRHYWKFTRKKIACIDRQLLDELHKSDCSEYGKDTSNNKPCSIITTLGGPHPSHATPDRVRAEILLFHWRVKLAIIAKKRAGESVDTLEIIWCVHREFPFKLKYGPVRLWKYLNTGLETLHSTQDIETDEVWDICTAEAADKFEKMLMDPNGDYGAGKQGKSI